MFRSQSLLRGVLVMLCLCAITVPVSGADWMFAQSYFTHPSSPGYRPETAPVSRSAYRRPYVNTHGRMAIRSGYRFNNYSMQSGGSNDRTLYQEYFIDVGN